MSDAQQLKFTMWISLTVLVVLMAANYWFLHSEVRSEAKLNRLQIERQSTEIVDLKKIVQLMRDHDSEFCKQYESDMDRFFRSHPENKRHPWICRVN